MERTLYVKYYTVNEINQHHVKRAIGNSMFLKEDKSHKADQ